VIGAPVPPLGALARGQGVPRSQRIATAIAALAMVIQIAGTLPAVAAERPEPKTNLADISDEVMCTVCGVPLELATEAPQANAERDFIRRLIAQGKTKDQIKDALVAQYGENVLAVPGDEGFDLAAWLVPAVAFVTAAFGIGIALRRWRHASVTEAPERSAELTHSGEPRRSAERSDGGESGVEEADPAGSRRLDEDMGRYRL
jgi:cytochrome c-type biogenesis protein CcmH